ncbi:uncharacterized protein LOC124305169 [Neodiprion virginianus]|uniref:uncharacterized protein LOC124305169 n=1 Tax=Neodiprion virginianus TaxID=2961670 RepID=UPI001EE74066|nr:uncharacterized protein LOC124305169 [Neodiprion virginianus]XP_046620236.1 uncharacterized protein LOC124305169 [Neodiprion virginianus]XP_046620237.1 uncharacterized protein LOC124305169 [Neodiprion virginianus]
MIIRPLATVVAIVFVAADIFQNIGLAAPVGTSYNQQQTGNLNVHIDLKDIQLVAVLQNGNPIEADYGDYDYTYDYSDFTIKPPMRNLTTTLDPPINASSTSSVEPWHTWPTTTATSLASTASVVTAHPLLQPESADVQPESAFTENASSSVSVPPAPEAMHDNYTAIKPLFESELPSTDSPAPTSSITMRAESTNKFGEDLATNNKNNVFAAIDAAAVPANEQNPSSTARPGNAETSTERSQVQLSKQCNQGYRRDRKGQCRPQIRRRVASSLIPFGIRLTPEVMQQHNGYRGTV